MKVRISTISPNGFTINEQLSLESLNTRMNEGRENDIVFTAPPLVDITVFKTDGGAEVKGTVKTRYRQPCSHCLEVIEQDLMLDLHMILSPKPLEVTENQEDDLDYQDDVGFYFYEGDYAELEEPIQEALILSLSRFWHPPVDAQGCCTRCHRQIDFDEAEESSPTISLGDLLKEAQKKKNQIQ